MSNYYATDIKETIELLNSSEEGLTSIEVEKVRAAFGPNELQKKQTTSPLTIFIRQFTSFIVVILIAAIVISLLIGEKLDAIVITIIVVLNGIFGFIQEYKAEKAIEALKKLAALKTRVIRNGKEQEIDSTELVPGDIILLETGDKIPADARLIETGALQVDESSLTGESVPASKNTKTLKNEIPITDQKNMIFFGSIITKGHAKAIVTSTGMHTQIGKIAEMVQEVKEKLTPLQEKLKQFGKWLGIITIGICASVFGIGVLREFLSTGVIDSAHVTEMFLASVALAVAAIPEGLPAIVTISLAFGVRKMVKRNALIRKLPAVETLGCTTYICSDKTGTLTKNQMTVREIFVNNMKVLVSGDGYDPVGEFKRSDKKKLNQKSLDLILKIGTLCNDSKLVQNEKWEIMGDPTEGALVVSGAKYSIDKEKLEKKTPRINEIPFDSDRKLMTTIHKDGKKIFAYTKGAPDNILKKCKYIVINGKVKKLTATDKKKILKINTEMANKALRVLGFAYKKLPSKYKINNVENGLTFVGLQAMIDPPRPEVRDAIKKCQTAGIKTVVITGDYKLTAIAITKELGMYKDGDKALSGEELDKLSDSELDKKVQEVVIYARASPEHKVRVLTALKKKGNIVAMTGDGVNDAPALKKSDIGVAMGVTGTDVAKEASDMILTDDNFSSIVNAVEEGRGIYNSIKQFIQYTLSSNLGEILVIFMAILIGWPLPLLAIHILWVNLLTDGLPGIALGLDPYSKDIMKRKPRNKDEKIITKDVLQNILIVGFVMGIGTLAMFNFYGIESEKARSIAFTTLIMFQLFNVLTYRAENFKINIKNSKFVIGSVVISILMQLAVLYTPLNIAFKTVPISFMDWMLIIGVTFTLYLILETRKYIMKKKNMNVI